MVLLKTQDAFNTYSLLNRGGGLWLPVSQRSPWAWMISENLPRGRRVPGGSRAGPAGCSPCWEAGPTRQGWDEARRMRAPLWGLASPRQPIRAILSVEQSNGNSVKDSDASLSVRLALQVCLGSRSQFPCGVLSCLGAFPASEVLLSLEMADSRDRVRKHASTDTSMCLTLCDVAPPSPPQEQSSLTVPLLRASQRQRLLGRDS